MKNFILYTGYTSETGKKLKEALNIPGGTELSAKVDILVRWGSAHPVKYSARVKTLNTKSVINMVTDKKLSLEIMGKSGFNTPEIYDSVDRISNFPVLGRNRHHSAGRDIQVFVSRDDMKRRYRDGTSDFFVEFIPSEKEYRIHVFNGEPIMCLEKRLPNDSRVESPIYIRNLNNGWVFKEISAPDGVTFLARKVVELFGLDFGAVDILSSNGRLYPLEVNTAPTLGDDTISLYVKRIKKIFNELNDEE